MTDDPVGANTTLADLVRGILTESDDAAVAYLRQSWLSHTMSALREARRSAHVTQEDIAKKLGTTQSAVARLERDHEGRLTLHRFLDFALACGTLPLDIVVEPIGAVRAYVHANPGEFFTQVDYQSWLADWVRQNAPKVPVTASTAKAAGSGSAELGEASTQANLPKHSAPSLSCVSANLDNAGGQEELIPEAA